MTPSEQRELAEEVGALASVLARTFRTYAPPQMPQTRQTLRDLADLRGRFVRLTKPLIATRRLKKKEEV